MDFTQSPDREDRDGKKWRNIRNILQHFKVSDQPGVRVWSQAPPVMVNLRLWEINWIKIQVVTKREKNPPYLYV